MATPQLDNPTEALQRRLGIQQDTAPVEAFRAFAEAARTMLASSPARQAATRVARAGSNRRHKTADLLVAQFEAFIAAAKPLVTSSVRSYLTWFEPHARRFTPVADDLLMVAGYSRVENSYSRLAAWVLGERNPSPLAAAVQARWLARVHARYHWPTTPLKVHLEFRTGSGTPDLVLADADLLVVVEAKTGTGEHEAAQTGLPQTEAYLPAVREAMSLPHDFPGLTIFLTLNAEEPAHADAKVSTFAELAFAILEAIEGVGAETAWPYRALASHWLVHAMPDIDIREVVTMALGGVSIDDRVLVAALHMIGRVERLVPCRGDVQ